MSTVQQQAEQPKPNGFLQFCSAFVSLTWLDGTINFIFRFVAKTSELLLAIGVVISAADFLTDGRLMHNNVMLANAWAWTQAISIESSSGVVLMYALQSFKEKDRVKGWLYVALAGMLALVGGTMLLTQIIFNTTGINVVSNGPLAFIIVMAVARAIVSIAYIVMCRIKHIRFTDLVGHQENQSASTPALAMPNVDDLVDTVVERLDEMMQQRFDTVLQEVNRTVVTVVQEEVTQGRLLAMPKQSATTLATPRIAKRSASVRRMSSKFDIGATIKQALIDNPDAKDGDLAKRAKCSINTARKYKQIALVEIANDN